MYIFSERYRQLLKAVLMLAVFAVPLVWFTDLYFQKEPTSVTVPEAVPNPMASKATYVSISPSDTTLQLRLSPPPQFTRIAAAPQSFLHYARQLPLKPPGADVLLYDGSPKANQQVHVAVLDQYIGHQNLHQCADAAMRVKADYLRTSGRQDDISFHLTNGHNIAYKKWRQGYRIAVQGNKTSWVQKAEASDSDRSYWEYLELIFMYAGTKSLSLELQPKSLGDIAAGDLLLLGGSPGHAVLVIDEAVDTTSGERIFLLAQSYMPAQEMHILKNPQDQFLSPWYSISKDNSIVTPEWSFDPDQLYHFID